ncbi:MAG: queuosine salvage family protein [SAR324 cluster bacterium]|nr:queuosine salvage family protein [SAR324 cluster bacterium]
MGGPFDFSLNAEDRLGVLSSTAPVAEGAASLHIDAAAVQAFAKAHGQMEAPRPDEDGLHCTFLEPRRFLNYLLALEALNFCFWDTEPRWRVPAAGGLHDGYWALAAALRRAIREDRLPLWEGEFLAELNEVQLRRMLRGSGRPPPLMEERLANLREAGRVLCSQWGGEFANLVENCGGSAPELAQAIVRDFPSFRDEAVWRGRKVRFYKRAQICVADLARMLPGHPLGRLRGLEQLTAFADYKVPQVLRKEGILVPAPELARRMDRKEELAAGSLEEVELRAATIWACEWIARALASHSPAGRVAPSAAEVDYLLWSAGQDKTGLPPYHRTRTIYY